MEKIIGIGDIHGKPIWKEIVDKEIDNVDKIIFVGDYFDCFKNYSTAEQISNFLEIIEYKKKYPEKIFLLIGNHDFHYMDGCDGKYSGHQGALHAIEIYRAIHDNREYLNVAYGVENILFSHAGVTNTWLKNSVSHISLEEISDAKILADTLNELFWAQPYFYNFWIGDSFSYYGDDITQGPFWVRPKSLYNDKFGDFIYVCGHTAQHSGMFSDYKFDDIFLIDVLDNPDKVEYLYIDENKNIFPKTL